MAVCYFCSKILIQNSDIVRSSVGDPDPEPGLDPLFRGTEDPDPSLFPERNEIMPAK
jgi:hypothetical protein